LARELSAEDLEYLTRHARTIGYLRDAFVFHESQPRRFWGMILKGRIALIRGPRGRPEIIHTMGPGDSYGEGSLLDDYPHSTSALVIEPAEVLEIPREAFATIAEERPDLYRRLLAAAARLIAERLRSPGGRAAGRGQTYISGAVRREKDLLGERDVPAANYYGIQTQRAVENFPITGIPIAQFPHLIRALAAVKEAAAAANLELGLLSEDIADAISRACREIRDGNLHNQFVVDVIQGGAGTS